MDKNITISPAFTFTGSAVTLSRIYSTLLAKFIFLLIWIAGIVSALLITVNYTFYPLPVYAGAGFILLAIFLFYLAGRSFYYNKILFPATLSPKEAKVSIAAAEPVNLYATFSLGLADATKEIFSKNDPEKISAKELILALSDADDLKFVLMRLGISASALQEAASDYNGKIDIRSVLIHALDIAIVDEQAELSSGDVLAALSESDIFIKKLVEELKISPKDLLNLVHWQNKIKDEIQSERIFLNPDHLRLTGGFGKDWAFGFTNYLRRFSRDITQSIMESGLSLEVIGRENEIKQIEEALLHQANGNVIVVGDAGSGKRTTILGFAKKVLEGRVPSSISHDHIYQLDADALLSGITNPGDLTEAVRQVLNEAAYAGNVIVFIENIQNLLSEGGAGTANVAEVIIPSLDRGGIHIIGTCDVESYNNVILQNPSLTERFTRVSIEEPDKEDMIRILEDTVPMIEYRTGTLISYEAIKETIKSANKYILNLPNPEKSISLLDGAATQAASERGETIVLPKDINKYVAEKYSVPSVEMGDSEKSVLLNLEAEIHRAVVGQDEAIKAIANAMRRARAQVEDSTKPIGSFLFLGPTGVGKTALAKALATAYFGKEGEMTRFDMSEYQNKEDIYRLIGDSKESSGSLVTKVREKPFSLLLFDEIEKANPDILNLFLQILDEGFLTDANGKKVSFQNSIIIATSNAGANVIREAIQKGVPYEKVKAGLVDYLIKEHLFKPELLNRFTGVIAFSPLTLPEINEVAKIKIAKLASDTFESKGITIKVSDDAISALANQGYDPEMGARPMERVIQEKIENILAEKILKNELAKGDTFEVTKEMVV